MCLNVIVIYLFILIWLNKFDLGVIICEHGSNYNDNIKRYFMFNFNKFILRKQF